MVVIGNLVVEATAGAGVLVVVEADLGSGSSTVADARTSSTESAGGGEGVDEVERVAPTTDPVAEASKRLADGVAEVDAGVMAFL